jgi:hypothetical protein
MHEFAFLSLHRSAVNGVATGIASRQEAMMMVMKERDGS